MYIIKRNIIIGISSGINQTTEDYIADYLLYINKDLFPIVMNIKENNTNFIEQFCIECF